MRVAADGICVGGVRPMELRLAARRGEEVGAHALRLLADRDRPLDERHVAVDAGAPRLLAVLGVEPLLGRAGDAVAGRAGGDLADAAVEGALALLAAVEGRVVDALLPVAGHAGGAVVQIVVSRDRREPDAGLEDRARRVAA